jgi:hypothetical protein
LGKAASLTSPVAEDPQHDIVKAALSAGDASPLAVANGFIACVQQAVQPLKLGRSAQL